MEFSNMVTISHGCFLKNNGPKTILLLLENEKNGRADGRVSSVVYTDQWLFIIPNTSC